MKTRLTATFILFALLICAAFIIFENRPSKKTDQFVSEWTRNYPPAAPLEKNTGIKQDGDIAEKILIEARTAVQNKVRYTPGYVKIAFPMGDLPQDQGVCTDLIIRSLRKAGYDLQLLINQDMTANFTKYPNLWSLNEPDPNIDHRRIPNQIAFLKKYSTTLPVELENNPDSWQPADIVYWKLPSGSLHSGIVSDVKNSKGIPKAIHILDVAAEEDVLAEWQIIAHFRFPKPLQKPQIHPSPSIQPPVIPVSNSYAIDKNAKENVSERPSH
ncbi:MAG: DUF1287 domain-containing protein [Planctomycetes bacterium]|nr:DUF1287 domain-containing protein [Planctomycetota bacterium]